MIISKALKKLSDLGSVYMIVIKFFLGGFTKIINLFWNIFSIFHNFEKLVLSSMLRFLGNFLWYFCHFLQPSYDYKKIQFELYFPFCAKYCFNVDSIEKIRQTKYFCNAQTTVIHLALKDQLKKVC